MSGGRAVALVVGLSAAVAACRDPAEPLPMHVTHRAVFGIVQVGDSVVQVLAEELPDVGGRSQIRDAVASVSGPGGTTTLVEAGALCFGVQGGGAEGCYAGALSQALAPSDTLTLTMVLSDGSEIHGALVTPGVPVASIPPDSQHVTVNFQAAPDNLPIALVPVDIDAAPGSGRVDVVASVVRAFPSQVGSIDPFRCEVHASTSPFSGLQLPASHDFRLFGVECRGDNNEILAWDSLDLSLHVVSMDKNYAAYFDEVLASPALVASRAGFGVDGAVGVFGAVATIALPLTVVFVPYPE